jgi:TonB family protein
LVSQHAQASKSIPWDGETGPQEGREEFQLSLLLHAALLLALTALFVWRQTTIRPRPEIVPVRLVAAFTIPKPGSGKVAKPVPAAKQAAGKARPAANPTPKPKTVKPVTEKKAPRPTRTETAKKPTVTNPGAQALPTPQQPQAVMNPTPTVIQDAPVTPEVQTLVKPVVHRASFDEVTPFAVQPAKASTMPAAPLAGVDIGDPLPMAMPDLDTAGPPAAGTGTDRTAPSGAAADLEQSGGAEFEIGGIESLGGSSERFTPPQVLTRVLPEYPDWARKRGIRGQALYKVLIQEAGTVGDVMTMSSTIDPKLAILGAQALRRWVFTPVVIAGEPRATWVQITVQFQLR